jgi:hypothetical protein
VTRIFVKLKVKAMIKVMVRMMRVRVVVKERVMKVR